MTPARKLRAHRATNAANRPAWQIAFECPTVAQMVQLRPPAAPILARNRNVPTIPKHFASPTVAATLVEPFTTIEWATWPLVQLRPIYRFLCNNRLYKRKYKKEKHSLITSIPPSVSNKNFSVYA